MVVCQDFNESFQKLFSKFWQNFWSCCRITHQKNVFKSFAAEEKFELIRVFGQIFDYKRNVLHWKQHVRILFAFFRGWFVFYCRARFISRNSAWHLNCTIWNEGFRKFLTVIFPNIVALNGNCLSLSRKDILAFVFNFQGILGWKWFKDGQICADSFQSVFKVLRSHNFRIFIRFIHKSAFLNPINFLFVLILLLVCCWLTSYLTELRTL